MKKEDIYSEIEFLIDELETLVKSLATAREHIAENSNNRATNNLSDIEMRLQLLLGKYQRLNQVFEGKVVTSEISIDTLSPGSKIVDGKDLDLNTCPALFSKEIT